MKKYLFCIGILTTMLLSSCSDDDKTPGPTPWPNNGSKKSGIDKTYVIGDQLVSDSIGLIWSDEFTTDGLVDETYWSYEVGHVRNNEVQYYTSKRSENCRIESGQLIITGRKEATAYPGATAFTDGNTYTSASIITNKKKSWKYGRFEIKAKVPSGSTGIWPAFWAKGDSQNTGSTWPKCGEIDIMEYAAKNPKEMIHNVIWGNGSAASERTNKVLKPTISTPFSDAFHIYSLNWSETQISFAIDNVVTFVVSMSEIDAICTEKGFTNPFHQPYSILLNLALGTWTDVSLGGIFDPTVMATDKQFIVDYVRVYQTITK